MIYLIIGRRKRGKTTLGYYMARKGNAPRVIFDPRGMIRPGLPRSHRATSTAALELGMLALADYEIDEVIYCPGDESLVRPFQMFCTELRRWVDEPATSGRPLNVLIDELSWIDYSQRDNATLRRVLRSCEPEIFNVFITCHRPVDVPVNTRSIADYWAIFHCVQEHDLSVIKERCGDDAAARVSRLTARSFVLFDDAESIATEYPDRPDTSGKNPWFVELRTVADRGGETIDRLNGLEKKLDGRLLLG